MRVILGNNYVVYVDNLNWTLKKIVNVEEKEVKGKIVEAHDKEIAIAHCKNFVSETNKSTIQKFCDIYKKGREQNEH